MALSAWYNENDPKAAAWLRELIKGRHIAPGDVDERSIEDVHPDDLKPYDQCHFFAGIGGWSLALRLVGVPDHARIWTASCPCQPFSAAGKGSGFSDERHLWPAFFHLVEIGRPPIIFGEQVASKDGLGWSDLIRTDLEGAGYAVGLSDLCSAGVKAADIRQRLYWMAHNGCARGERREGVGRPTDYDAAEWYEKAIFDQRRSETVGLAHHQPRPQGRGGAVSGEHAPDGQTTARVADGGVGDAGSVEPRRIPDIGGSDVSAGRQSSAFARLEHAPRNRRVQWWPEPSERGVVGGRGEMWTNALDGPWRNADWLYGRDGFWRPVEAGTFPLAHGVPGRVGLLRGYGNAINPHVAAAFIEESLGALRD